MKQLAALALLLSACTTNGVNLRAFKAEVANDYRYSGTVDLFGEVNEESTALALARLKAVAAGGATSATLRIDSPGGEIYTGMQWIRDVGDLKKRAGLRISCVVDGAAMSMAAVILESPVCDRRLATPNSLFLFHNGSGGARGTVQSIQEGAALLDAMNAAIANLIAGRMGMTPAQYRAKVAAHAWVLATPDALASHVIDAVVAGSEVAPP